MIGENNRSKMSLIIFDILSTIPVPLGAVISYVIHGEVDVKIMAPYVVACYLLVWVWSRRTFKEKPADK